MSAAALSATSAALLPPAQRWAVRVLSALLWALVAGSATYWLLRMPSAPDDSQAVVVATAPDSDPALLSVLLGQSAASGGAAAGAPASALEARAQLLGVMAQADGSGAALIAVDGQPAQPCQTGGPCTAGCTLQSLTTHSATLACEGASQGTTLKLASAGQAADASGAPQAAPPPYGAEGTPQPAPAPPPALGLPPSAVAQQQATALGAAAATDDAQQQKGPDEQQPRP